MGNQLAERQATELAVVSETNAVLSMIERVACDPQADVAKLEKMLDLQERVLNRQAEQQFFAALNACQQKMGRVSTDAVNPQTRSKYASYAALDRALRPIYTAEGISISYDTEPSPHADHILVVAHVAHQTGHHKRFSVDMPADGKGAKGGDVMTKTHAAGAAMSYGMRYLLKMIFNVAVGEDDNDGNVERADTTDWVSKLDECATIDDLRRVFNEAWGAVKDPKGRATITAAKNKKGRELTKGAK